MREPQCTERQTGMFSTLFSYLEIIVIKFYHLSLLENQSHIFMLHWQHDVNLYAD